MSDSFFIHPQHHAAIVQIYPPTALQVQVDDHANARKQTFTVSVDQMTSSADLLQIRLCDAHDATRMLVSTIDAPHFERIKRDQLLNCSFADFVQHLRKLLEAATKPSGAGGGGELHASLHADQLQFYERRAFRNLVHLSLPIAAPTERYVMHYMQLGLSAARRSASAADQQLAAVRLELAARDSLVAELRAEGARAATRLQTEEQRCAARLAAEQQRHAQEATRATDARAAEERKQRHAIKTLQDTLDFKTRDALALADQLAAAERTGGELREELHRTKLELRKRADDADRHRTEAQSQRALHERMEQTAAEQRAQLAELRTREQAAEKRDSDRLAELEAERHIARTKRLALELATDEISRANAIIVKQAKELGQLVKKCEWRTEVALRQEQRIGELEREREALRRAAEVAEREGKENADVGGQLRELRAATDDIGRKYARKINELREELNEVTAGAATTRLNDCTNTRYIQRGLLGEKR